MNAVAASLVTTLLLFTAQRPLGFASPSTVPAFLWSPHLDGTKETVDYSVLSPSDLAKSVMTERGWSNLLCSKEEAKQSLDLAVLFVGSELQSLDLCRPKKINQALVDLLKVSFSDSNFSVAFPFVSLPEEKVSMESSLISEFANACQHDLQLSNIAFTESCSVQSADFDTVTNVHSVHDYLLSRMTEKSYGQTNLIVFCHGGVDSLEDVDQSHSESRILSELLTSVKQLDAKYAVLYVSDPSRSIQYPSHRELGRFLAEGTFGNGSVNSKVCDGVCQIKSSLLEGILVGIVLLVILISGLCCMMGIDTPTRFEATQDS